MRKKSMFNTLPTKTAAVLELCSNAEIAMKMQDGSDVCVVIVLRGELGYK